MCACAVVRYLAPWPNRPEMTPERSAVGRSPSALFVAAMAEELPLTQRIPFGTTDWRISMHRRQVVESANAGLKGAFADLSRGFFRVFGRVKISVLLGFTIAAYNLDRVRSFRARQPEGEHRPKYRAKRRLGIWRDLIDSTADADPEDDRAP